MNKFLIVFFVLFSTVVFGQLGNLVALKGQVSTFGFDSEGVCVINLRSELAVFTDQNGSFVMNAIAGDTLVFSGMQFKRKEVVLCAEDFYKEIFKVHLTVLPNQLNEVVIRNYTISAESLGIIPFNQKKYTPAERKYATAASYKMNPQGLDPILNLISGRTAMLKKEMEVEKKESYMAMLEKMFDKDHFINTLHLPLEYVKGFEYYVVENEKFTKILEQKNKTTIEFLLGELAEKYKQILACESE